MRGIILLLILFWLSRLPGLETLPLHNDEGLHLTRAVEVWNLHPFWEIRDGKIINHWAIALFYPQNAPVFAGRIATVFVSMIGLAAGYALLRRRFGTSAALLGGAMWIASPYLFFFERLAFSDAEAGALVVLALWAGWRLAQRGTVRQAVFAAFAFGMAALFKFTAAPFALGVALIVLLTPRAARARYPLQRRILLLVIVGVTVALMFAPPVGYLLLRGDDLFSIAFGWIGGGSGAQMGVGANLNMLVAQLTDFGVPIWSGLTVLGIVLLVALRPRAGGVLPLAVGLPLATIVVLGREVLPRHYVVALPALLLLGGAGIGATIDKLLKTEAQRQIGRVGVGAALAIGLAPLALTAYTAPEQNPYPQAVWTEHFSQHSAGYGLREAVEAFPQTIQPADAPVIASMTGDSCRRANFYAENIALICGNAPGLNEVAAALETQPIVYVLVEQVTGIRDVPGEAEALGATAEQIAVYLRPGADGQTVTLWRLERAE